MSVMSVSNNVTSSIDYLKPISKDSEPEEKFSLEEAENGAQENMVAEDVEEPQQKTADGIDGMMMKPQERIILLITNIVDTVDPKTGKRYTVYFYETGDIKCVDNNEETAWTLTAETEEQQQKIKDYFANYKPDHEWFQEFYSGEKMSDAASKEFWMELFAETEQEETEHE